MDGAAAEASTEDTAQKRPHDGGAASENIHGTPTEDSPDRVGVFCCRECGEAFSEEAAYLEHLHQHPQEGKNLDDKVDGLHNAEKDFEMANFCNLCSLSFVELSDFYSHMETMHGQTSQKDSSAGIASRTAKQRTYECLECGKIYSVIGHFLNHQRSHKQASKSVFSELEDLKKKSFQCETCGRNYSRASALDAHRRCHEERLVKRNRSSGDALHTEESPGETKPAENQTEESPEKLYKCSCGKSFTAMMRLKTHQRFSRKSQCSPEEMKEKPKKISSEFTCSECNKAFNGHIALFNHQRWHANRSNDKSKKFSCEECGKVFMTLTFYYRHQRLVHSVETPSKSFLHQVCQLQKKAFECQVCGLKFSRASALHSHELHHTDVFKETEKEAQVSSNLLPQPTTHAVERKETQEEPMEIQRFVIHSVAAEEMPVTETDEEVGSYDPGDFNVQVISASESEDEAVQDQNPDLELLCESDQEVKDDGDTACVVVKQEMDLNIVQVDLEQPEARFDCPDCYRWFTSAASLRVHRMWHGVRMRRQHTPGQSVEVLTCDICGHEASSHKAHCRHIQQHNKHNTSDDVLYQAEGVAQTNLTCNECGKRFSRLSALVSHQMHHPKRKQFQCPDCMMSYSYAAAFLSHMTNCSARKKESISTPKKEYNPNKTLLGPKSFHCEQCGKGFWSLGAYSHHKQSQTECADLRLRKGFAGSLHINRNPRSGIKVACPVCGRKFRHKGIMALHMRKHENGNHKCELCNKSFRLFSSLLRHQVVHSDQLLPPPIKSFQHQVEQLKKNTYSCPDCGKLFSREKALQFHMKSHGYETGHSPSSPRSSVTLEELQCATCFAHFSNKASLRAHQKLCIKRDSQAVVKTEPSESDTLKIEDQTDIGNLENLNDSFKFKCDKSFSAVGALNFHKKIHTERDKPLAKAELSAMCNKSKVKKASKGLFHCPHCARRFRSNSALGSHKRWHKEDQTSRALLKGDDLASVSYKTEGGNFQCHKCGKQFFNHRVLQRHQMFNLQCKHQNEPSPDLDTKSSSSNSKLSCPECKKSFPHYSLLVAHCKSKHGKTLEATDHSGESQAQGQEALLSSSQPAPSALGSKTHSCPLCSMTFAKVRGLRAHKWQAHSKSMQEETMVPLSTKTKSVASNNEIMETQCPSTPVNATVTLKNSPDGEKKKSVTIDISTMKYVTCLDCGKQCISASIFLEHKKRCPGGKQGLKQEIQSPETKAEISSTPVRLSEHTAKCLFKCDKCGKAFQTEEQVRTHKSRAKSRPHCCALCCQGFWTENQLQQHLVWHDEVRCRLPNEVRHRLSAALASKHLKLNVTSPDARGKLFPPAAPSTLSTVSQSQSYHKCQHCGKAFLSPTALQKHETQHCSNDSYHCSICPRTFSEIQDLIDHHQECIGDYKRSDAPTAVSSGDDSGLTCIECGTTFCQETDLHQHYIEHCGRLH